MATLYELTNDYMTLLDMAQDPNIDPDVLTDNMDSIYGCLEEKIEGYICVMKEVEALEQKYDSEIKRLTAQKTVFRNNLKRMKDHVVKSMNIMGMKKIRTEHFGVSVANNGGVQPMEVTDDINQIPDEYRIYKPEANTEKIRKALENGAELGFAHLSPRGQHLSIR